MRNYRYFVLFVCSLSCLLPLVGGQSIYQLVHEATDSGKGLSQAVDSQVPA